MTFKRIKFTARTLAGPVLASSLGPAALGAQAAPSPAFVVREVWSSEGVQTADGVGISKIRGLAETALDAIWVSDVVPGSGRVLKIDPKTMRTEVIGRRGDGPGEVLGPRRMAILADGKVAVYDIGRGAVEVYEPEGEPAYRVQLLDGLSWVKGFAALRSGGFVVSGWIDSSESAVHYFSQEGVRLHGWGARPEVDDAPEGANYPRSDDEMHARFAQMVAIGGPVHALSDGSFLYSRAAPHEIVLFRRSSPSSDGWSLLPVGSMSDLLEAPGLGAIEQRMEDGQLYTGFNTTWPQSAGVFELDDGSILNVVVMQDEGRSLWQVFDPAEALANEIARARIEVPVNRAYVPLFLCENGDVLAVVEDPSTGLHEALRLRLEWSQESETEGSR